MNDYYVLIYLINIKYKFWVKQWMNWLYNDVFFLFVPMHIIKYSQ